MKKHISLFCICILLISCHSFDIEKRRYMKGYHVSLSKNNRKQEKSSPAIENAIPAKATTMLAPAAPDIDPRPEGKHIVTASADVTKKSKTSIPEKKVRQEAVPKKTGETLSFLQQPKKKEKEISWAVLALATGLMGGSFAGAYHFKRSGLLSLQAWSHKNRWKARSIIVLTRIALTISGFAAGVKLFEAGHLLPQYSAIIFGAIYITGILVYPFKKLKEQQVFSLLRRKVSGLMLSFSGLILCMTLGNHVAHENANGINTDRHINKRSANYFESKKSIPADSMQITEDDENDPATMVLKGFLLVLTILSVIALQIILLAGSCLLACDGAEGAAVALAFGGTLVLAALSIATIYWIKRINLEDRQGSV